MGKFLKLVDTPEALARFRVRYCIPPDVQIRLPTEQHNVPGFGGLDKLFISILAIVEGGVRFPLHPLLREVLEHYKLSPMQLSANFFRVVMGTAVPHEHLR